MNDAECVLDSLIDEFVTRSRMFVQFSCYLPGLKDLIEKQKTIRHVYDHEYLAFTKSAKTLISIKYLLVAGNNEDVNILNRSLFENYLAARYLNENVHDDNDIPKLDEFIKNRVNVSLGIYSIRHSQVLDEKGVRVARLKKISSQLVGLDSLYYYDLYAYLSSFVHFDFSVLDYYVNEYQSFELDKKSDTLLSRLVTVFIVTKIFECIVTVNGEDFYSEREKEKCFSLVRESLISQRNIFNYFIDGIYTIPGANDVTIRRKLDKIRLMLINMNNSLVDDIGDIDKSNLFSTQQ